ncbi:hypothetical protein MUK42_04782 [Musa troglodytarum]|uniref:Uncharacterized protein n=1 Tax=Musa troglodytarum TaxID=320322 RepID=A0A9E7ID17_9LILI|nr:hypothetical protein MUK42_04782 [Musa troglodytarum]
MTGKLATSDGVRRLHDMAASTADRRFAYSCMEEAAAHIQNLRDDDSLGARPGPCSVELPFAVGLQTDCGTYAWVCSLSLLPYLCAEAEGLQRS